MGSFCELRLRVDHGELWPSVDLSPKQLVSKVAHRIGHGRTIFFTCSGVRGDVWGMLGFDAAAGGGVDGRSLMVT